MATSIFEFFSLPLADPIQIFFVIVFAVFLMPWLARRVGFPEVIALIIFGIILGPHGFGILAREGIRLFASVGLLFLMFIAGLEIDGNDFQKHRDKSLWFGVLTFIIPLALGTFVSYYLLNFSLITSILLASMFSSHTLLAYPIAMRQKITTSAAVSVAVGGTIITDVAALLVLSVIANLSRGLLGPDMLLQMGISLTLFTVFELAVLPRIAKIVYEKLEKEGDLQFLFTLLVLFGSGVLAEIAGVEPIIGAFLAGLAVSRHIPRVSPLANRVDFFGGAVFIPAFLISVGMIVDPLAFFTDTTSIIVSVMMVFCVVSSKWLAAKITCLTYRWDNDRCNVIFGLSVVQAAATLAAVLVGYELGIFNDAIMNGTIVMILVTIIIGSLTVQKHGDRLAKSRANLLKDHQIVSKILFAIDKENNLDRLVDFVLLLRSKESSLKAVTVIPADQNDATHVIEAENLLDNVKRKGSGSSVTIDTAHRADNSIVHAINSKAYEFLATDTIVDVVKQDAFFSLEDRVFIKKLAARTYSRLTILRLMSSLATIEKINAVFLKEVHNNTDFKEMIQSLKKIARNNRTKVHCYGSEEALTKAAQVIDFCDIHPTGTAIYTELDFFKTLSRVSKKGRKKSLTIFFATRPDHVGGGAETNALLREIEHTHQNLDFVLIFPSRDLSEMSASS